MRVIHYSQRAIEVVTVVSVLFNASLFSACIAMIGLHYQNECDLNLKVYVIVSAVYYGLSACYTMYWSSHNSKTSLLRYEAMWYWSYTLFNAIFSFFVIRTTFS